MTDIQKELQKLRALINQKQTTAIFSNKSNESTKLSSGDTELFINDMSKRFSFTRAGVRNPVNIDPREKSINNLEYINGAKVSDITGAAFEIDQLRDITSTHDERITKCETDIQTSVNRLDEHDGRIDECDSEISDIHDELLQHNNELVEHSMRIQELEKAEGSTDIVNSLVTAVRYEDLPVKWTYDDSMPGYFRIKFTPAITIDNFRPSRRDVLVKCTLSNGFVWEPQFQKYWDPDTESYGLDLRGGELNNGVLTYNHGYTSATTTEVIVYDGILVTPVEGLNSERFANAIIESTRYGMTNAFLKGDEDVPLDFTYTFDENNTSSVVITFSTSISDEYLIVGNYSWLEYGLSNGSIYTVYYNKYQVDTGYEVSWGGSWDSTRKIFTINHGRGYKCVSVTVKSERFIKPKHYAMQDDRMTAAVINSITDSLMTEQTMQKETGSSCTYTYSYNNSTGVITINFAHEYEPDNLKYGKDVTFVTAIIRQYVLIVMSIGVYWTYDKTPKSDGSYSITWWLHDVGNGTTTTVNPTYSKGVWSCASGRKGSAYSLTSISVPGTIHVIREDVTIKSIRPSPFRTMIVDFIYPIGSVYVSFDKTSPAERFGVGTWLAITDRFLYCTTGSGVQGGSRYITEENLPEHKHGILNYYDDFNFNHGTNPTSSTKNSMPLDIGTASDASYNYTRTTYTESAGLETAYMPEYITVFAWRRTG